MVREPSTVSCADQAVEAAPKRFQQGFFPSNHTGQIKNNNRQGGGGVSEVFSNGPKAPGRIPSENASRIGQIETGQTHPTKGRNAGSRAGVLVKSYWSNHTGQNHTGRIILVK